MDHISDMGNGHDTARRVASQLQENLPEQAQDAIERVREVAGEWDKRTRQFVHDHPTAAVLGAVAIGFVVGRFLVRRW